VSTPTATDRYTALPDEQALAATVVALEEHGFSVDVVDGLDAARDAVLARIPEGSSVMTNTSVTLQETGIADAINDGRRYESARNKMFALDFATQAQEMKAIPADAPLKWVDSTALPKGAQGVVLVGDPSKGGKIARPPRPCQAECLHALCERHSV